MLKKYWQPIIKVMEMQTNDCLNASGEQTTIESDNVVYNSWEEKS